MKKILLLLLLALVGCGDGPDGPVADPFAGGVLIEVEPRDGGSFAGTWASCRGAVPLAGVEETTYWLQLLIDTTVPIVGNASQRAHGAVSNDGDRNIIDAVDYILSRIWADASGRDSLGPVVRIMREGHSCRPFGLEERPGPVQK